MLKSYSLLPAIAVALLVTACGGDATGPGDGGNNPGGGGNPGPTPVAVVELDVANLTLDEGGTRQLIATLKDSAGQPITGRFIQWSSSALGVVDVGSSGLVTGLRAGTARIVATVQGKSDTATVLVHMDSDYNLLYDAWNGTAGVPPELYQLDIRHPGSMPARLFRGKSASDATPSPDGTRVAFAAYVNGRRQLFAANIDGTAVMRLAESEADDDEPAWSPDGTTLVFARYTNTGFAGLHLMNAAGGNERPLMVVRPPLAQFAPTWSPDGKLIAFRSKHEGGIEQIYTVWADGSKLARRTFDETTKGRIAWIRRTE